MKRSLLLLIFVCSLCILQAGGCGTSTPPPPPITVNLAPSSNQALDVNQSVSLTANVGHDTSNQGVNWTVTCPAGVTTCGVMAQAKTASGAPDNFVAPTNVSAAEMVTVKATSVSDPNQSASLQVQVNPAFALVNPPPPPPQPGTIGQPFSLNLLTFVQGGTPPFTWSIKSGTLPAGLTLSPSTGMVTGTPQATAHAVAIAFNGTDAGIPPVVTNVPVSLTFNPAPLVINTLTLPNGSLRTAYGVFGGGGGFVLTASGGVPPYKWSWAAAAGSSLPPGLNFSSNVNNTATISGVPTMAGSFVVAVTVSDSQTPAVAPVTKNFPLTVTAPAALTISSGSPPQGIVDVNYGPITTQPLYCTWQFLPFIWNLVCHQCPSPSVCASLPPCNRFNHVSPCRGSGPVFGGFTFTATGGVPPYTWSSSTLPPGLSVNARNGEIIGTPTLAGTYNVSVTVTDSGTPQVIMTNATPYSVVIKNPPPPVINTIPAPPAGAVNLPYTFTFTAVPGVPSLTLTWSETGALIPGLGAVSPAGVLSGTPTATGSFPITVDVQDSLLQSATPKNFTIQIFAHGFKATGSMANNRVSHTTTLLNNGKVLVVGGTDANGNAIATAELYDPTTGSFSPTGSMATARAHFAATFLSSGKVLVTGGLDNAGNPLATAEIYDPSTETFSATSGSMQFVHASHTATLLNTGKVLVAGWGNATAELFDPATGTFAPTGSMATARVSHTATLLSTGKVLLTGGVQGTGATLRVLAEAELYDPTTGSFSPTLGSLATARQWHTASLLASGKVLVTGGLDSAGNATATAELFDPTNQSFTPTTGSMGSARAFQTATVLKDGTVLVTGGDPPGAVVLATAELYDPTSQNFTPTGTMGTARASHTATLLLNGTVLVTGGVSQTGALATAEVYQ